MKKYVSYGVSLLMILVLSLGFFAPGAMAADVTDPAVLDVIAQLEAIDTLQQMQDARSRYNVTTRYDAGEDNAAKAEEHMNARVGYETYVSEMFAARVAAQQAYDALSADQQAQIDPALVAKLSTDLPTTFRTQTYAVTPRYDEYTFEAAGPSGLAYEVSTQMISGQITQTFALVDTADGKTQWTPSGRYVCGESNYDVAYCCDVMTPVEYGSDYRRINLEDSNYYGPAAARQIRAILQNAYPYITLEEMKANLKAGGLDSEFVDSLSRGDVIAAVQGAIWTYANAADMGGVPIAYMASIDVRRNVGIYFTPLHDYTNECWEWLPGTRGRSYDARAEYRVNTLIYYLCNLEGVDAGEDQIIISDVQVTRADLIPGEDGTYNVGLYVFLNNGGQEQDNLTVTATSFGTDGVTGQTAQSLWGQSKLQMYVKAHAGDTIRVTVEGTQTVATGVYFYEPENGRESSQSLVGVSRGRTNVKDETSFLFGEEAYDMGLRIHKTAAGTGLPLSDITFSIYSVVPGEGEVLSQIPTAEELAIYQTEANKVTAITTDATGYASTGLAEGIYLVVEEFNAEKVKLPVDPFYITVPMQEITNNEDGTITTETIEIISVYPKNEPVSPPEPPPPIPPTPDTVTGRFEILKYDSRDPSARLAGAEFEVYYPAIEEADAVATVVCDGVQYAVCPVLVNGEKLVLVTDENGWAISPELSCGTYFILETKAPAGYSLPGEAVSVTVMPNVLEPVTPVVEIPNEKGSLLPETGGAGTRWLMLSGSILTIGALVLLVTKKRMSAENR